MHIDHVQIYSHRAISLIQCVAFDLCETQVFFEVIPVFVQVTAEMLLIGCHHLRKEMQNDCQKIIASSNSARSLGFIFPFFLCVTYSGLYRLDNTCAPFLLWLINVMKTLFIVLCRCIGVLSEKPKKKVYMQIPLLFNLLCPVLLSNNPLSYFLWGLFNFLVLFHFALPPICSLSQFTLPFTVLK